MDFRKEILKLLKKEIKEDLLEVPSNPEMGDYALPCFTLAKAYKKAPQQIAQDLAKKIKPNTNIKEIKATGPYLNFFVNKTKRSEAILKQTTKEKYAFKNNNKKTTLVEFPSPNTNKPLHLGHLRNMALGESVSRILESQGSKIKRLNLNNDRGIHICKSMLAYQKWGKGKEPNKKSDHFIGDYYVLFAQKAKKEPKLEDEAREMLRKWELGDKETIKLWKKMNKWAFEGFKETYKTFGIKFDKEYYESKTYFKGKEIVLENTKKGLFKKDDTGATLIDLGGELGEKILLRADGTSVYITQDLYLANLKYNEFKFNKSVYVVGNEQNYHFKVLFKILDLLGYKYAKDCYHLSYGMVSLPEGKMKSREGTVVDADDLMDDLFNLARKEVEKRNKLSKTKTEELARKISLSALKFYLLKHSAHKDFTFNPKESISFEGETGPYLQYSLVRAKKIKKQLKKSSKINYNLLIHPAEQGLVREFSELSSVLEKAAKTYSPHAITVYAYNLASSFNRFYELCPVIKAENDELQKARYILVDSYINIMGSCLWLLGIETVEQM
ncbi:arginine--tRNA ligase [archaeon]|jgi:arginyl-tRNA synthetase|nr:arginine--tRNA ligase [archaeon]MBT4417497.1 arginine--tRNA ligase [archaeon]